MRVLTGKVVTGVGNFSFWIEKLQDRYRNKTGLWLFPGTLNIQLDSPLIYQRSGTPGGGRVRWGRLGQYRALQSVGSGGCHFADGQSRQRAAIEENYRSRLRSEVAGPASIARWGCG